MRKTLGRARVSGLTVFAVTIAGLYFAQEVLIPLAMSILLAFLLSPLITLVQRRLRLPRVPAVIAVAVVAFASIFALCWVVGVQVVRLAEDLPRYQAEIAAKVQRLRGSGGTLAANLEKLNKEIARAPEVPATRPATGPTSRAAAPAPTGVATASADQFAADPIRAAAREAVGAAPTTATAPIGTTPANPFFAVALPAPVSPIKTLGTYLGLVLGPLGTASLVVVFVIFMLLDREDLRDRSIRLISGGKYTVTTRALDDAAQRISRYVSAQAILNGSYGLVVALGLWVIGATMGHGVGFPSFVLWGLLCALLRFIPYVGPAVASLFPLVLSLAVYPGFAVFAAVAGLLILLELVSNNVLEPWMYGASTGLSTMAIMIAAVVWTWLWGPMGLFLSTPLTVCIVVLGKHVRQLKFLDVLLGDRPALPPAVRFYQRLLADDPAEATTILRSVETEHGPDRIADDVILPALRVARRDRRDGDLSAEEETKLLDAIDAMLKDAAPAAPESAVAGTPLVFGCPAHHRSEEPTLSLLPAASGPAAYRVETSTTRALPADIEQRVRRDGPAVVVIAVQPPGGIPQARHLCRRLRKAFPALPILVAYWGRARDFDRFLVRFRRAGASYVTTTMVQTRNQIRALVAPPPVVAGASASAPAPAPSSAAGQEATHAR